jgi:uncharacterized protein (TIGR00297 family)
MTDFSETRRQLVHILAGLGALLLKWLTVWQAALFAVGAVLINRYGMPRWSRGLFRTGDLEAPLASGIVLYPLTVLALILAFPHRLDVAAVAWVVLAAGDGMATLAGTHVRTARLPWNSEKSVGGLCAFLVFGSLAAVGLTMWIHDGGRRDFWMFMPALAAAVVAALVETAPIRLNDNISVPVIAALTYWTAGFVSPDAARAAVPEIVARLPVALGANGLAAAAGWVAGTVTTPGAVAGCLIGVTIYAAAGLSGWVMLMAAFLAAAVMTRLGLRRKLLLGIAEDRGGRRGPGNAIANTSVAAWAALVGAGMADRDVALIAMVGALVTSASDTVASEIGKAWGKTTWLLIGWRRVQPGTSGAVSLEGTLAGIAAAALLTAAGVWLNLVPAPAMIPIVLAATIAALAEGALGALFEGPGILDNDALNFVNSIAGAGLALLFWSVR